MASSVSTFTLCLLLSLCFLTSTEAAQGHPPSQEADRVLNLPGQPSKPSLSHYSGYVTVNQEHGRSLFYWLFKAQHQPSRRPLLLWLNGGPGCSSVGYGAAVQLGPLRVKTEGFGLEFNKYSWYREANLLFVESPIGVGFSFTKTPSDLTKLDDGFVAEDAYNFLVNWLKRFPQYRAHDFYISGESYAGHYVPQLADLVYERNKDKDNYPFINLKGFIVGNPETDEFFDSKGLVDYAWSHAIISDQVYEQVKQACDFRFSNWTGECLEAMFVVYQMYGEIDIYNIYAPKCLSNSGGSFSSNRTNNFRLKFRESLGMRIPGGYDPCFSTHTEQYFNDLGVLKSIHAIVKGNIHGKWKVCNDSILATYHFRVASVLPIYSKLTKAGLKIWIYSGDADGRVPVIGSRYWVEELGLPLKTPWRSWYHNHQVGGRFVDYQGLTFVTVRGAGHMVPMNKPKEALLLIQSFLWDLGLPTHP